MILKSATSAAKSRHPLIMPRPSSKCFIFEMETVKLICFSEKCFILNPEDKNTQAFIRSLKAQFRLSATNFIRWSKVKVPDQSNWVTLSPQDQWWHHHEVVTPKKCTISGKLKLSGKKCNELSHVTLQDFEQVVLETALENVVSKYSRHLEIIKPALEMLLQQVSIFPQSITPCQHSGSNLLFQVEANPETNGLPRLLAVKKSLAEFEQNVELVSKVSL